MKLLVVRTPSQDYGLCSHQSCVWLTEKVKPWASLDFCAASTFPLPTNYDAYVLMGDDAHRLHAQTVEYEDKGYVHLHSRNRIPQVCTYDIEAASTFRQMEEDDDEAEEGGSGKDLAPTQPKNHRFWILSDIHKLRSFTGLEDESVEPVVYPTIQRTTAHLEKVRDHEIVIDIETRYSDQTLSCIGLQDLTARTPPIVVPIYNFRGYLAYDQDLIYNFIRSLSTAFTQNVIIGHNLAFDLLVLAAKYKVIFGERLMDTMLMHHRCFQVDKSLGHVIRRWANFPWHKHENVGYPRNDAQEAQHHLYNAKDVHRTGVVYQNLKAVARSNPCLASSMRLANDTLYESLCTTLRGMLVDSGNLAVAKYEALIKAKAFTQCCEILSGDPSFNPRSSDACVKYFHRKLAYKVVARTDTGAPSLDSKALFKLAARYDNPLLRFIIAAREAWKEVTTLEFEPWKLPLP